MQLTSTKPAFIGVIGSANEAASPHECFYLAPLWWTTAQITMGPDGLEGLDALASCYLRAGILCR